MGSTPPCLLSPRSLGRLPRLRMLPPSRRCSLKLRVGLGLSATHVLPTSSGCRGGPRHPGRGQRFGHGVVDALLALQTLRATTNTPPRSVIDSPGADLVIDPNTSVTFQGSCVDAEVDQPFIFAWNFSDVAPPTAVQNLEPSPSDRWSFSHHVHVYRCNRTR